MKGPGTAYPDGTEARTVVRLAAGQSIPFTLVGNLVSDSPVVDASVVEAAFSFGLWHYASCAPSKYATVHDVRVAAGRNDVVVHTTETLRPVAAMLADAGVLALDDPPDLDGRDWWIWCEVAYGAVSDSTTPQHVRDYARIECQGLATDVDVWWNDTLLGHTDNMFVPWSGRLDPALLKANTDPDSSTTHVIALHCHAMTSRLAPRRPRARWRSRLLESQEWRWHRTTHLGRMPGVGPRVPPVGAWQPLTIRAESAIEATQITVRPSRRDGHSELEVSVMAECWRALQSAVLHCGDETATLKVTPTASGHFYCAGALTSDALEAWWPHTHGVPATYEAWIIATDESGEVYRLSLGSVGFREIAVENTPQTFGVSINGTPMFLRGTCWTPGQWAQLDTLTAQFAEDIPLLLAAGINCVRFSGCFVYPTAQMLTLCDRHGIAVWHDFMFNVLDYPRDDTTFVATCVREVAYRANEAQQHASVLVLCGNSEVEQQAAMMGIPSVELPHALFHRDIAAAAKASAPGVFYWPGTPWGGDLPTRLTQGTAHYFGVGAYRRDFDDARRAAVRFATECLAFACLPEPESPSAVYASGVIDQTAASVCHVHVPKDGGATWNFADIRDHYAKVLYGESGSQWSLADTERYAARGRSAVATTIERTLCEFRRVGSPTRGALTWLWRDPWHGAGWGMIDHAGRPKSAWYGVRQSSQPVALGLTNEGMDGVVAHCWNDGPDAVTGVLTVRLLTHAGAVLATANIALVVDAHAQQAMYCDDVLGKFADTTYAFQFGQAGAATSDHTPHDLVHVAWWCDEKCTVDTTRRSPVQPTGSFHGASLIGDATCVIRLPDSSRDSRAEVASATIAAQTVFLNESTVRVELRSESVCRVRPHAQDWWFEDAYFTLVPGVARTIIGHVVASRVGTQPGPIPNVSFELLPL